MHDLDFDRFVAHANAGRYRDALLALEEVWKRERCEFLAGVLQLLVALNQRPRGMMPSRTLARARERIAPFAPTHAGLDVAYLLDVIAACERGEPVALALPTAQLNAESAKDAETQSAPVEGEPRP